MFLILAVLVAIFFMILVPESPKWLYTFDRYETSRENLVFVAKVNGLPEDKVTRI